jgi:hypothetical protein
MRSIARTCVALALTLGASPSVATSQTTPALRQRNDAIVFDLFLNYELTEKNGNLSTLMDYLPARGTPAFRKIEMSSNYGGEDESATFAYGDRGRLERIDYRRGDRLFVYEISYDAERPVSIAVGGRKRIDLTYRNDTLVAITRERNGALFEYALDYRDGERRADIGLVVVMNGKRARSSSPYFVVWDDRQRIAAFSLDVYTGRDITYADAGDVATFAYFANDEQRTARWDHVRDAKSTWTERRFRKLLAKRTIQYATP